MKHISILILEGDTSLSNIEGAYKMFNMVNGFLINSRKPAMFKVQLVGASKEAVLTNGLFKVMPEAHFNEIQKTDLIIIPAVHGESADVLARNQLFLPWILEQHSAGAEVASLCIGAFLLASTGLLDGKECSTHWLKTADFKTLFPGVSLVPDKIITDERGIYTSGGAYSSLNLILYLVEKYAGREMSVLIAKVFEIEYGRYSQSPFIIFRGLKEHKDEPIKKVQEYIEDNFSNKITVDKLAELASLNRRSLERRFKKATTNTVLEYIQNVKIEAAKKNFETTMDNVNEVMYKVGYTDAKAFRIMFRKSTGLSPLEYRSKYNREAIAI